MRSTGDQTIQYQIYGIKKSRFLISKRKLRIQSLKIRNRLTRQFKKVNGQFLSTRQ